MDTWTNYKGVKQMKVKQINTYTHQVQRNRPNVLIPRIFTEKEKEYWKHRLHASYLYNETNNQFRQFSQYYINKYHKFRVTKTGYMTYELQQSEIGISGYDYWPNEPTYFQIKEYKL